MDVSTEKIAREMAGQDDVKRVVRLEPVGDRFRYLIETSFESFPRFVIGNTDEQCRDVRIEFKCGDLGNAMKAWRNDAKVSDRVAAMEKSNKALNDLVGEILATIDINRKRGSLTSADDEYFSKIVNSWRRRYEEAMG